jgi:sugar lactone lactonase YvrE
VSSTPDLLLEAGCLVGEGPSWDERAGALLWVDIVPGDVFHLPLATRAVTRMRLGQEVAAVIPRASGGYVLALPDGVFAVERIEQGAPLEQVCPVEPELTGNLMNDTKCDPAGRLWAGTRARDWTPHAGGLYRLDTDLSLTKVLGGTTTANGLGWSPDARRMYFVDSAPRTLDVLDYDLATGEAANRRRLVDVPADAGSPDGLAVDAEGGIWVAMWGGAAVHRYAPDGTLDAVVRLPTPLAASCCFGGADLSELYVTTGSNELPPERRADPTAGALYVLRPGVRGLPTSPFGG